RSRSAGAKGLRHAKCTGRDRLPRQAERPGARPARLESACRNSIKGEGLQRRHFVMGGLGLAAMTQLPRSFAKAPWDADEGAPFDGSMVRQLARERAQAP